MKNSSVNIAIAGFVFVLMSLAAIAVPSVVLAENEESQSAVTHAGADTLTFLSSDMPPFGALKDGKPVGFAVEILQEIMRRLGRDDTIEFSKWDIAYKRVLTEPDTALWPPSRTPEREQLFKWVGPLIPEKIVLFARRDAGLVINSLEEAKRVGGIATVTGYASEKLLKEKGFSNLVSQRSSIQGPDALKFGRVDLWLNSNITMKQTALDANVDPDLFEPVFVVKEIPSYLAFSKSVPGEVVNRWQAELDKMKRDGSWEKIVSKWVPGELQRTGAPPVNFTEKEELWLEAHPTVKVVQFFQEPPFTIDETDSHTGYLYDLLFETLRMAGLKAEFVGGFPSYDSMVEALHNGAVDILTTMENTRLLPDNIVRTVPVVKTPYALVAKINAPGIKQTSELFGRKVAVVKGYAQDQHLDRFPRIEKVHVKNNEEGFEAVRMGRAEYFLNNLANAGYVLKKTFATDLRIAGTLSYVDFPPLALSFGIHGKDSALPGIINKALKDIPVKSLAELQNKWLPKEYTIIKAGKYDLALTATEKVYLNTKNQITMCIDPAWMPYEGIDESGNHVGITADYFEVYQEMIGIPIQLVKTRTWDETIQFAKTRECDIISLLNKSPERSKYLNFTEPYLRTSVVLVARDEVVYLEGLDSLSGKTLAIVKNYIYEEVVRNSHPKLEIVSVENLAEGLQKVSDGKVFAAIGSLMIMLPQIQELGLANLKIAGHTKFQNKFRIGVRNDDTVLLSILDKAVKAMDKETENQILQRWYTVSLEESFDYSMIWKISSAALIILIMVLYWNRRLQKEVAERKHAEEVADAANQAKSEFLANMSHELRTPLNAILGFTQIMERNSDNLSDKENLGIIQRSGSHLLTLINQVLDLSKIEAGQITTEENCFDLLLLLDELENMLSLKTDKKDLTLKFNCLPEVPRHICTDEVKLRQVLINLLSNAIKFTGEGSVTLRISLKNHSAPKEKAKCVIQFEIEDTGPGIAPEEMDRLFKAFGQTASGREAQEGTGLGLAISHRFIQLMGGDMHVTSEVGQGTKFSFDIQVRVVGADDITPKTITRRVLALEPGQPRYRLLIVDDKWDNRQLLIKLLKPFGFDLREAENGQEAVDLWEAWQPHLIWMDLRMPVMDGYEATRRIRAQDSSLQHPSIIAVTANVLEEGRAAVMSIGCDDIVIKPFKEADIIEMLQKHLKVKFLYATDEIPPAEVDRKSVELQISPADFADLPKEMVMKLKESVAALEMDTAFTVIEEIRGHNQPLAEALQKLVEEYRFDKLQKLLDQSKQE